VKPDPVYNIVHSFNTGSLTAGEACAYIVDAAGDGDAEAIFAQLPLALRGEVTRYVAEVPPGPDSLFVVESHCATGPFSPRALEYIQKQRLARYRGILALHRVTHGSPGGG
jgi:hypothetical protein